MVRIQLFGTLLLAVDDAPPALVTGRCASLLAYLALARGRSVSRSELLERVWSDRADRLNAGTLNTALCRLRGRLKALGTDCESLLVLDSAATVAFNPRIRLSLDVVEFERLATSALHAPGAQPVADQVTGLEAAVALYRADLMLDHGDDWVVCERERQRRLYLNARGRLMDLATQHQSYDDAISHAQAILQCEPLREDVHCALMRVFVAAGQRALALRQYEHCRTLLRSELAIMPMPDTLALYQRIADGALHLQTHVTGLNARDLRGPGTPRPGAGCHPDAAVARPDSGTHVAAQAPGAGTASSADARHQFYNARRCLDDANAHLKYGLALLDG